MSIGSWRGHGDPWWDTQGRTARRRRRRSIFIGAVAVAAIVVSSALATRPALGASLNVDLDQWASLDAAWQNGNLNGNNSRYPEGGVIPFRLAIEGLTAGSHQITIQYDFTASGHKAYDFLAGWSVWTAPGLCLPSGGAISSRCPNLGSSATGSFPTDPFVANGLAVSSAQAYSAAPRYLTIYGGTITSIGSAVHAGSVDGNSTAQHLVRFHSSGSAVLLVWGGHLAQSAFWDLAAGGPRDGAGQVSGAPWHMRTLNLDGSGARNQDRSIQPSAIVGELPPLALAPSPAPTPTPTPALRVPAPAPGPTAAPGEPLVPAGPRLGSPPLDLTPPPTSTGSAVAPPSAGAGPGLLGLLAAILALAVLALVRFERRQPR